MAKRKKIAPPEITEVLLKNALAKYEECQRIQSLSRAAFYNKKTKKRFTDVGKTIQKLSYYWNLLSPEEIEAFFIFVNQTHTDSADLLLGTRHLRSYGDMAHDVENEQYKVKEKLAASIVGYNSYLEERKAYNLGKGNYAYKELLFFLAKYWEMHTGTKFTYTKNPHGDKPAKTTKWITECLEKLTEMGATDLSLVYIESRVEEVYNELLNRR